MTPSDSFNADLLAAFSTTNADRVSQLMRAHVDAYGVDSMIADLVVPAVWELERLWAEGRFSVLHERQVSALLRTVTAPYLPLSTVGRGVFVMACPPGETHDIRQHLFAVLLQQRGIATLTMGPNVAWKSIAHALHAHDAAAWALYVSHPRVVAGKHRIVQHLARTTPTYVAGPAASITRIPQVENLPVGWVEAADHVARNVPYTRAGASTGGRLGVAAIAPPPAPAEGESDPIGFLT